MLEALLIILALLIIIADVYFNTHNPLFKYIFWILKIPIILFEYFILIWFWGGDGLFTLISVPFIFGIFGIMYMIGIKKNKENKRIAKVLTNSFVFFTPILSAAITYLIALLFGVEIEIH